MRSNTLRIPVRPDPILPLLDPTAVPDLPQPARAPESETVLACPVVCRPAAAPALGFAVDSAIIVLASLVAAAAMDVVSPGALARGLPGPVAGMGFALLELATSATGPLWPVLYALSGCTVAFALACGRLLVARVRESRAPRRLVVGPTREVARFVGDDGDLESAATLNPSTPSTPRPVGSSAGDTAPEPVTLTGLVLSRPIDEVVLLRGWKSRTRCQATYNECETAGVDVAVELEVEPLDAPAGARLERRGERTFARYTFVPRAGVGRGVKWALEYAAALLLTATALPLMAVIALAIRLSSPGPVVFRQMRTGLNGRRIPCFKFRTMVDGAHAAQRRLAAANEIRGSALLFKMNNDPRVTRVGRFLRCTSLDELPQLFNVLRGELSLIGPRLLSIPLAEYRPAHRRRLSVRPGIACVWQAWHRGETDFEAWMRSDLEYLDRWSLTRDLRILMRTAWVVLRREGAR